MVTGSRASGSNLDVEYAVVDSRRKEEVVKADQGEMTDPGRERILHYQYAKACSMMVVLGCCGTGYSEVQRY